MKELNNRLYYLDNVKVFLIMLVVAHHAGQPYGGSNGFWYFETDLATNLGKFFSVNAAFFMSLFFMISAYFLPGSIVRKGNKKFLKERFIRLGIPLIIGFFLLIPIIMYFYYINFRNYDTISFLTYYQHIYFGGIGAHPIDWSGPSWPDMQFAHLWFIEHLLVYAIIFTAFRYLFIKLNLFVRLTIHSLTNYHLLGFTIIVALITFFVRIENPIDQWVGFLGFIQTEYAHVPQYVSFFLLGLLAYTNNWFNQLSHRVGITWLTIGLGLAIFRYVTDLSFYAGGGTSISSIIYAFYETFLCTGLCIGIVYFFKEFMNKSNKLLQLLSRNAFGVYILHVPIVVAFQYSLKDIGLNAMSTFLLVTLFGIIGSFLLTYLIRKIPIVNKVL
ncbi:peptidoglycan/LPS O-acetylase OafA/YrhL [Salirhabdus euzebyi]|uniref:Peptidoglycan/LPS O-acetylase OafA/YrhL n=1 Tax=Salirhabdus euzebyi TaxID=394506 RepID=A0A841Q4T3_9BACI|nr:acyltransferase family protein [Salirhabdus euzebyi]MBB6453387.1 peptidoglycan/LPS O-acetylase OafA/YrhL [Salirhabdus euzebyi]